MAVVPAAIAARIEWLIARTVSSPQSIVTVPPSRGTRGIRAHAGLNG